MLLFWCEEMLYTRSPAGVHDSGTRKHPDTKAASPTQTRDQTPQNLLGTAVSMTKNLIPSVQTQVQRFLNRLARVQ
jgi:hypothetical protein